MVRSADQVIDVLLICWYYNLRRSATTDFPHPLVNILQSNAEKGLTNVLSYALAELMTWQGLVYSSNIFAYCDAYHCMVDWGT